MKGILVSNDLSGYCYLKLIIIATIIGFKDALPSSLRVFKTMKNLHKELTSREEITYKAQGQKSAAACYSNKCHQ